MSSGSSLRHLLRLAVLLALVLVLMRSSRNTQIYEPFFGNSSATGEPRGGQPAAPTSDSSQITSGTSTAGLVPSDAKLASPDASATSSEWIDEAIDRVVDGSVFAAADADAYYALLDSSRRGFADLQDRFGEPDSAPRITVVPLLQQPRTYRGTMVRVRGWLRRVERIRPIEKVDTPNKVARPEHFRLWLRPQSGADRPMVVAVPDLPSSMAGLSDQPTVGGKITVDLAGVYLKRLAYRSGGGADLAPLIVASPPTEANRSSAASGDAPSSGSIRSGAWTGRTTIVAALMAIAAGIAAAVMAMRSSNRSMQRLRRLRQDRVVDVNHLREL